MDFLEKMEQKGKHLECKITQKIACAGGRGAFTNVFWQQIDQLGWVVRKSSALPKKVSNLALTDYFKMEPLILMVIMDWNYANRRQVTEEYVILWFDLMRQNHFSRIIQDPCPLVTWKKNKKR